MSVKREHLSYMRKHARLDAMRASCDACARARRGACRAQEHEGAIKAKTPSPNCWCAAVCAKRGLAATAAMERSRPPRYRLSGQKGMHLHQRVLLASLLGCACRRCRKTNREYWIPKFERNVERDRRNIALLEQDG